MAIAAWMVVQVVVEVLRDGRDRRQVCGLLEEAAGLAVHDQLPASYYQELAAFVRTSWGLAWCRGVARLWRDPGCSSPEALVAHVLLGFPGPSTAGAKLFGEALARRGR